MLLPEQRYTHGQQHIIWLFNTEYSTSISICILYEIPGQYKYLQIPHK